MNVLKDYADGFGLPRYVPRRWHRAGPLTTMIYFF
jgi:hypothetical protein